MRWIRGWAIWTGLLFVGCDNNDPPLPPPASQPATMPATQPVETKPITYIDLAKESYPKLPTTRPLDIAVNLDHAAHIALDRPVHLDLRGDLWITDPDAPPTEQVLQNAVDEQIHLARERVLFVHWPPRPRRGPWRPMLVVEREDATPELIGARGERQPLESKPYRWNRAVTWQDKIIVPASGELCVLRIGRQIEPICHVFEVETSRDPSDARSAPEPSPDLAPRFVFDSRGLLAWIPWDDGTTGGRSAARFVDNQWTVLGPDEIWPEKIIQLLPLLDGSVLQVNLVAPGVIAPAVAPLDAAELDDTKITQIVEQLSDYDPEVRDRAFQELSQYGPGAWPLLERLMPDQPPEGQIRLEQILSGRISPTLGTMHIIDGKAKIAARLPDGGVIIHLPSGVEIPEITGETTIVPRAWIGIRPGGPIRILNEHLTHDARPGQRTITAWGGEWLAWDAATGWRRLMGNHLAPLLKEDERHYDQFGGIDRRGRWIFRTSSDAGRTLILDPTIPDPTPRLPVWIMRVPGETGWDRENWPAVKSGGAWRLGKAEWEPVDEKTNAFITEPPPAPEVDASATTQPTEGPPLLVSADGTRYFGGQQELVRIAPDGTRTAWSLPPEATGTITPHLVEDDQHRLFLFNAPGRVLRIKPTPDGPEPYELEATFTRGIPNGPDVERIWKDPAGRIIISAGSRLIILFPDGQVPPHIERMIPAGDLLE